MSESNVANAEAIASEVLYARALILYAAKGLQAQTPPITVACVDPGERYL